MKYFLVCIVILFWPAYALAVIPEQGGYEFEILRNGDPFGTHTVKFSKDGDNTIVDIEINMEYTLGPFTFFRYEHVNREVWKGDQILSLNSQTNDDGDDYNLNANWTDEALVVEINGEVYEADPSLYSTSYWNPVALDSDRLLNSQKGQIEDITVEYLGEEEIAVAGSPVQAKAYFIQASVPIKIWYENKTKQWVKLAFTVRGSELEYVRVTPLRVD